MSEISTYDAGLLNDFGGGDVGWWQDYIRCELARAYEHYSAAIAALQAKREWRAIETAPKDGTRILVLDQYGQQTVAWWAPDEGGEWSEELQDKVGAGQWIDGTVADWGCQEYRWLTPNVWQPLPAPPITEGGNSA